MVIKFRDIDVVRSSISFLGEEMPSVSAGACQIDASQEHFLGHELIALTVTVQAPGGLGWSRIETKD